MTHDAVEAEVAAPDLRLFRRPAILLAVIVALLTVIAVMAGVFLYSASEDLGHTRREVDLARSDVEVLVDVFEDRIAENDLRRVEDEGRSCVRDDVLLSMVDVVIAAIEDDPAALAAARDELADAGVALDELERSAAQCEVGSSPPG